MKPAETTKYSLALRVVAAAKEARIDRGQRFPDAAEMFLAHCHAGEEKTPIRAGDERFPRVDGPSLTAVGDSRSCLHHLQVKTAPRATQGKNFCFSPTVGRGQSMHLPEQPPGASRNLGPDETDH